MWTRLHSLARKSSLMGCKESCLNLWTLAHLFQPNYFGLLGLPRQILNLSQPQGLCTCCSSTLDFCKFISSLHLGLSCITHVPFASFMCLLKYYFSQRSTVTTFAEIALLSSSLSVYCFTLYCFSSSCLSQFGHCLCLLLECKLQKNRNLVHLIQCYIPCVLKQYLECSICLIKIG